MNKKILKRIEEIFTEKLQAKTGWGKNEVLAAYKDAVNEALSEYIHGIESNPQSESMRMLRFIKKYYKYLNLDHQKEAERLIKDIEG